MGDLFTRHVSRLLAAGSIALGFGLVAPQVLADGLPSGERMVGNTAGLHGGVVEPAYDYDTGNLTYLLTPTGARSNANAHAIAPLYLVAYPPGTAGTFNCMGYHGNCPDHDWLIANAAVGIMPGEYGLDPTAVPGHDHLVGLDRTGGDFNVAWHVYLELFTPGATVTHITTLQELQNAWTTGTISRGNTGEGFDSGITFNCSAVSASIYNAGTPLSG